MKGGRSSPPSRLSRTIIQLKTPNKYRKPFPVYQGEQLRCAWRGENFSRGRPSDLNSYPTQLTMKVSSSEVSISIRVLTAKVADADQNKKRSFAGRGVMERAWELSPANEGNRHLPLQKMALLTGWAEYLSHEPKTAFCSEGG